MEIKVNNESNKNNSLREVQEWCRGHRGKFPLWILIYRKCAMLYTMSSTISLNTEVSLKVSFLIIPKQHPGKYLLRVGQSNSAAPVLLRMGVEYLEQLFTLGLLKLKQLFSPLLSPPLRGEETL